MKKILIYLRSGVLTLALALMSIQSVNASSPVSPLQVSAAYYVSPAGNDTNAGTINAPFKTIAKAASQTVAGDTIVLLPGSYTSPFTITDKGTQNSPITIRGEGVTLNNAAITIKDSNWLIIENLTLVGGANQITLQNSHFLAIRNNTFDYLTRGIYIQNYSSHILIENNEFYQSCATGKTWTALKGSTCEGGAVYGSSYGGGSYHIRNNWVHDSFNGFLFTDDSAGQWMNANVFIYNNRFERIVDDPAEPEGDSFNFHVFNNTMIDTHRMVSMTAKGVGPVFVYNNVQITNGNPTGESTRLNSAFKLDFSTGGYVNGTYLFNNTIVGEAAANFYAYDMLSRTISYPLTVRNNVYVTKLNAFNKTPTGGSIDYDISKAPFGMTQPNGIVSDPLIQADGSLSNTSKAVGKSTQIVIPTYFSNSTVISSGSNLGAYQFVPSPVWVLPPGYPSTIPAEINGWVETLSGFNPIVEPGTSTVTATPTQVVTLTPTAVVPSPTMTAVPTTAVPATAIPETQPTSTATEVPTETPPATETPQAPTEVINEVVFDDTDPSFVYSPEWTDIATKKAIGNSYKETYTDGASVTFTFTGQSFSIIHTGGPAFRSMDVYVDDVLVGSINQRIDTRTFKVRWDYTGQLDPGEHVLKLVFVTNKASNTKGSVDAVIVR